MQHVLLLLLFISSLTQGQGSSLASVQKVIQMLTNMEAKAKEEKKAEEVAFAKFTKWCEGEVASLKKDIKKNKEDVELVSADMGKLQAEATSIGQMVTALNAKIGRADEERKEAKAQRKRDHEDFLTESRDYTESIDAIERAIAMLQKQNFDRSSAPAALVQLTESEHLSEKAKSLITEFMGILGKAEAENQDPMSWKAPEANAYEFQSGGVLEMLKRLADEFKGKLSESQKQEMSSQHSFEMVIQDLTESIANANKELDERSVEKDRKTERAATLSKEVASTQDVLAENKNLLESTTTECREKSLSFQEKQQLRGEEAEAIAKAIEVLSSPEVADSAAKHLSLAQAAAGASALVQLGEGQRTEGVHRRVREFLAAEASRLHSGNLGLLAEKVAADPYGKVKTLIENMILKLTDEATEDADHNGFCEKEMGKSKITRNKLTEEIDGLQAAVEEGKATISSLAEGTAELTQQVAELTRSIEEATQLRAEEKAKNAQTVKDAVAAQKAVMAAVSVLKEFYKKALAATALVQQGSDQRQPSIVKMGSEEWKSLGSPNRDTGHTEDMQTFGDVEKGQQEDATGVLGLLEVIQADFTNLEANTKAAEAEAKRTYDQFMAESRKSQAVKEKKIELNSADKAAAESKLQEDVADMKSNQDELLAAERYHKRLAPQCVDRGNSQEERNSSRQAEIASLKEALEILGPVR